MTLTTEQKKTLALLCAGNADVLAKMMELVAKQSASLRLHARSLNSTSAGRSQLPFFSPVLPLCIDQARGARIRDVDGNEYIDCHMGYTAGILGHNPPAVVSGLREAIGRRPGAGYFVEEQVQLADLLHELLPNMERFAFLHTGADAVAAAVRVARAGRGRTLIAKFEGCYHGWHDLGMYNTATTWAGRAGSGPLDQIAPQSATGGVSQAAGTEYLILPFGDPLALARIRSHADELAAVVVDPAPRFMMRRLDDAASFVRALREVTASARVPLIFDEVVTGFRLSPSGAAGAFGVTPDLACYGKITAGLGIPLSIVAGRAALLDAARTEGLVQDFVANKVWISTTHAANSLAVTAALLQLRELRRDYAQLFAGLDENHAALCAEVASVAARTGIPLSLEGHPRLYSMLAFTAPAGALTGNPARDYYQALRPHLVRWARLLTLYLRLQGVYMETLPTTDLSTAHAPADIRQIGDALGRALAQMREHGVFA